MLIIDSFNEEKNFAENSTVQFANFAWIVPFWDLATTIPDRYFKLGKKYEKKVLFNNLPITYAHQKALLFPSK